MTNALALARIMYKMPNHTYALLFSSLDRPRIRKPRPTAFLHPTFSDRPWLAEPGKHDYRTNFVRIPRAMHGRPFSPLPIVSSGSLRSTCRHEELAVQRKPHTPLAVKARRRISHAATLVAVPHALHSDPTKEKEKRNRKRQEKAQREKD